MGGGQKLSPNLYPIKRLNVQEAHCDLGTTDSSASWDQIRLNCNDLCGQIGVAAAYENKYDKWESINMIYATISAQQCAMQ